MKKEDEELLAKSGWVVECESPLEIRREDGSFATMQAAEMVLSVLQEEDSIVWK